MSGGECRFSFRRDILTGFIEMCLLPTAVLRFLGRDVALPTDEGT